MYVIYVHKYAILTFFCAVVPTYMHTIRRSCHTSWTNTHIHKTRLETLICTQCNSLFGFWISFFSLLCFVVRLFSLFYIQISRVFVRFWRKEKHAAKKKLITWLFLWNNNKAEHFFLTSLKKTRRTRTRTERFQWYFFYSCEFFTIERFSSTGSTFGKLFFVVDAFPFCFVFLFSDRMRTEIHTDTRRVGAVQRSPNKNYRLLLHESLLIYEAKRLTSDRHSHEMTMD